MQIRFLPGRGGAWISESNLLGILPTVVQSWWVYTSRYPASLTTACDPNLANWTVSPMALNLLGQEKGFFFFFFLMNLSRLIPVADLQALPTMEFPGATFFFQVLVCQPSH